MTRRSALYLPFGLAASLALAAAGAMAPAHSQGLDAEALCRDAVNGRGYDGWSYSRMDIEQPPGAGFRVRGQVSRGAGLTDFHCIINSGGIVEDVVLNVRRREAAPAAPGRPHERNEPIAHDPRRGAPAEWLRACAAEGDRRWRMRSGATAAIDSRPTGRGAYEVRLQAGRHRGVCTIDRRGVVRGIVDEGH